MTKKQTKVQIRKEVIIRIITDYGYKTLEGNYLISMWDLQYIINNNWKTKYFVTESMKPFLEKDVSWSDETLPAYETWRLRKPIRTALGDDLISMANEDRCEYIQFFLGELEN